MTHCNKWLIAGLLALGLFQVGWAMATDTPAATGEQSMTTPYGSESQAQPPSEAQKKATSGASHTTQSRIREAGVFQQSEGQLWRTLRNGPVTFYGGWLLVLLPLLILTFYKVFGPLRLHDAPTGRKIQRFDAYERGVHWATAGTFVLLALTGLIILFGKHVLLPVVGYGAFSWMAVIAKNLHNLAGPLFFVSLLLLFRRYVWDNLPHKVDLLWIRDAHNVLRGKIHVPSYKYNAAEKAWFWGAVTLLGLVVSLSGFVLDFPVFGQGRHVMQIANLVHGIGAILFIAGAFGHIYMGTLGADGALQAMKTGMVDETWAREHHQLWYEKMKGKP